MSSSIPDRTGRGASVPFSKILPQNPVLANSPMNKSRLPSQRSASPVVPERAIWRCLAHCKGAAYYA
jgi:hypothetical protein